jgi:hypothetical protein
MSKDEKTAINKGVELMLRRVDKDPKTNGFKINKCFSLHNKQFCFRFEITWGSLK